MYTLHCFIRQGMSYFCIKLKFEFNEDTVLYMVG